nr:MAG TPA: hypothetical protein [Caudoviricetes sp.]
MEKFKDDDEMIAWDRFALSALKVAGDQAAKYTAGSPERFVDTITKNAALLADSLLRERRKRIS